MFTSMDTLLGVIPRTSIASNNETYIPIFPYLYTLSIYHALRSVAKGPSIPVTGPTESYWQIPPHKKLLGIQSPQLPSQCEIAVIGSGVSACSTIHELFASGFRGKIVVLEAREICSGATGRNGGRIHVHAMQDYDKFRKRYGDAAAEKIVRFQMLHYPKVESVVKSLQPEHAKGAALRETTSVAAAFSEEKIQDMKRMLANFEAAFSDWVGKWKIVGAEEAQKKYKIKNAHGAMIGIAGAVWPYRLVTGVFAELQDKAAGVASVGYSVGQMLLALVAMGMAHDDGTLTYIPDAEQTVAVSIAVLILQGIYCSLPSRMLSKTIQWFTPVNLLGAVAISITILVLTDDKLPASEVFGKITDGSGWHSTGFSYLIGYLSIAWSFTDYDATAHMSEELHNAAISGPVAIVQSLIITWLFGLLLNIAFGFCAVDPAALLSSPFGNPVTQVLFNAAGRKGGIALWFWVTLVQVFTGATAMLSVTRTVFALARDEMFPGSKKLRKMNSTTHTPLYSVWSVVIFCCLLNLIALGSAETINGIFGITAPACDISYAAVIMGKLYYGRNLPIAKGPFNLGRFSKPINIIACVWTIFISVILFFPPTYPVTASNMNYAVAIAGFICLFATAWWYMGANKRYIGPRNEEHRGDHNIVSTSSV